MAAPDLIVVEGYMDVIALHQSGFTGAVAPLGTALTPEQLEVLWQVDRAPILCFDGDGAGRRAAVKAAETGLPLLAPEHSLRICLLPDGEDPDSLVRQRGAPFVAEFFAGAAPLSSVLFDLLVGGISNPGPEERAALRRRLSDVAALIPDKALAAEYRVTLLDRFFATFRQQGRGRQKGGAQAFAAQGAVRDSHTVDMNHERELQRLMLLLLVEHPQLVEEMEEALCRLDLPVDFAPLRGVLLDLSADGRLPQAGDDLRAWLEEHGQAATLAPLMRVDGTGLSHGDVETVAARTRWWHFYGLLYRDQFIREVTDDVARFFSEKTGDTSQWQRLQARLEAMERLRRGGLDDADI